MAKLMRNVTGSKLLGLSAGLVLFISCGDHKVQVAPNVNIPRGMRALSVISDIPVAPHNHVDVLVVGNAKQANLVLQNMEIVAVDKGSVNIVTFFVSPDDVKRFESAVASTEQSKVRLRLRTDVR